MLLLKVARSTTAQRAKKNLNQRPKPSTGDRSWPVERAILSSFPKLCDHPVDVKLYQEKERSGETPDPRLFPFMLRKFCSTYIRLISHYDYFLYCPQ